MVGGCSAPWLMAVSRRHMLTMMVLVPVMVVHRQTRGCHVEGPWSGEGLTQP